MKAGTSRYAALVFLLLLSVAFWIGGAVSVVDDLRFGRAHARSPFDFGFRRQVISGMETEAQKAGARVGDRLLAFDGRPFTGYGVMRDAVRNAHPGTLVRALIQHSNGTTEPIVILLAPQSAQTATLSEWVSRIAVELAFPLFCLILGFWVAAVRPQDRNAWLLLGIMISLEFLVPIGNWNEPWQVLSEFWSSLVGLSWPAWMMLFGIYFPERSAMDLRFPWIKWLIVGLLTLSSLSLIVYQLGMEVSLASTAWLAPMIVPLDATRKVLGMAAISLFFASLGQKSSSGSTPDARRRIRLVWLGAAVGLTPGFIIALVSLFTGTNFGHSFPAWILYLAAACMAIFPLTLAYVILVQRAMDVRVALRQSLQYALARGGLWLLRALLFAVAIKILVDLSQNRGGFSLDQTALLALAGALLLLRRRYEVRLRRWIDKRFFRTALNKF